MSLFRRSPCDCDRYGINSEDAWRFTSMEIGARSASVRILWFCSFRTGFSRRIPFMVWSLRWRRTQNIAVASLVLAVIGVFSVAEARAGCDHPWVNRPVGPTRALNDLKVLARFGGRSHADTGSPGGPGQPSPCAHGACSRVPAVPMSSSEPIPRRAEIWGLLNTVPLPPPTPGLDCLFSLDGARPRRQATSVERPPR
jgi:hypothetical protein